MMWRKAFCEAFGTFTLVFVGTGAIIINDLSQGKISHLGISLTFGLTVLALIYALGEISGAHLNPAVTLGFVLGRRFPVLSALQYVASQLTGGIAASLLLHFMFPSHGTLGATLPSGSAAQSFVLEVILTLILMFVILQVSTGTREKGTTAGIAVGAVIAFEALFAGPISGASMNPARSLAPAIVSMQFKHLWIYVFAPLTGSMLGVFLSSIIQQKSDKEQVAII